MEHKIFEFIWDQSKKNTDKALVEQIVDLHVDRREIQNEVDRFYEKIRENREEMYNQLEVINKELCREIDELRNEIFERLSAIDNLERPCNGK